MNVEIVSFADFQSAGGAAAEMTNRFMYKIVAMLFSPFEEVLMMDGDNIALRDPETLFDAEDYVRTGSLLWMDFWRGSSAPDCQVVLGNATKLPFTHESGQMLVHKRKIWDALGLKFTELAQRFLHPLSIGYMGLGDKEIVAMSLLHLGLEYGLVSGDQITWGAGPRPGGGAGELHDAARSGRKTLRHAHQPRKADGSRPGDGVHVRAKVAGEHDPREKFSGRAERSVGGGGLRDVVLPAAARQTVLVRR